MDVLINSVLIKKKSVHAQGGKLVYGVIPSPDLGVGISGHTAGAWNGAERSLV